VPWKCNAIFIFLDGGDDCYEGKGILWNGSDAKHDKRGVYLEFWRETMALIPIIRPFTKSCHSLCATGASEHKKEKNIVIA